MSDFVKRPGKRDALAVHYDGDKFVTEAPAGAFRYTTLYGEPDDAPPSGMNFKCPCGCGSIHGARFRSVEPSAAVWTWDGNREKPTVAPSLGLHPSHEGHSVGADGYHWHGFLKAGVFEEC